MLTDSTNDLEVVKDARTYAESPNVATDGGPRSRAAKPKPIKKLTPPEEYEPFDRESCLRKPLEFVKPLGTVYHPQTDYLWYHTADHFPLMV